MRELAVRTPINALRDLSILILGESSGGGSVELSVRMVDKNLSARDMAAFLDLIDHIYGRSTTNDFRSYGRRVSGYCQPNCVNFL